MNHSQGYRPPRSARSEQRGAVGEWRRGAPRPLPVRRTAAKRSRIDRIARWAQRQHDHNNLLWALLLIAFAVGYVLTLTRYVSA